VYTRIKLSVHTRIKLSVYFVATCGIKLLQLLVRLSAVTLNGLNCVNLPKVRGQGEVRIGLVSMK